MTDKDSSWLPFFSFAFLVMNGLEHMPVRYLFRALAFVAVRRFGALGMLFFESLVFGSGGS
jgi:hypothetical protein